MRCLEEGAQRITTHVFRKRGFTTGSGERRAQGGLGVAEKKREGVEFKLSRWGEGPAANYKERWWKAQNKTQPAAHRKEGLYSLTRCTAE